MIDLTNDIAGAVTHDSVPLQEEFSSLKTRIEEEKRKYLLVYEKKWIEYLKSIVAELLKPKLDHLWSTFLEKDQGMLEFCKKMVVFRDPAVVKFSRVSPSLTQDLWKDLQRVVRQSVGDLEKEVCSYFTRNPTSNGVVVPNRETNKMDNTKGNREVTFLYPGYDSNSDSDSASAYRASITEGVLHRIFDHVGVQVLTERLQKDLNVKCSDSSILLRSLWTAIASLAKQKTAERASELFVRSGGWVSDSPWSSLTSLMWGSGNGRTQLSKQLECKIETMKQMPDFVVSLGENVLASMQQLDIRTVQEEWKEIMNTQEQERAAMLSSCVPYTGGADTILIIDDTHLELSKRKFDDLHRQLRERDYGVDVDAQVFQRDVRPQIMFDPRLVLIVVVSIIFVLCIIPSHNVSTTAVCVLLAVFFCMMWCNDC
mmetsp:Transcript_26410/g.67377  ORF Transcript_26410/g.67377 Transcript_26410/m.67377 type:complete len:427 (+) Transcript_26410:1692-2972(+)